ncbi:MAG: TniQ family protein, partial [Deinococcus sp.]|nr:TniQ family protein [Deinococcus sp.]
MRLAQANVERLTFLTTRVGGDRSFWTHDPDRWLRPEVRAGLCAATGVPEEAIEGLTMRDLEGTLFPILAPRATIRWVMPLGKSGHAGYRPTRAGLACCPVCLAQSPFLRREWRLSFVTACPAHGVELLDACPECGAAYAPLSNDLGRGRSWVGQREPPFAWCAECGHDFREDEPPSPAAGLTGFQAGLASALETGVMVWPGQGADPSEVLALEGFDVLHQLLAVLLLPEVQGGVVAASGLRGPQAQPERRNRSFEDFGLADRRLLLVQLAWLIGEWPGRFVGLMRLQGVTRRPLVVNMSPIPEWYDEVAEQLSQRNGKRPRPVAHIEPHLSLEAMQARLAEAQTDLERRRWSVLCRLIETPDLQVVARQVGMSDQTV